MLDRRLATGQGSYKVESGRMMSGYKSKVLKKNLSCEPEMRLDSLLASYAGFL
jgi:hypothetical protein